MLVNSLYSGSSISCIIRRFRFTCPVALNAVRLSPAIGSTILSSQMIFINSCDSCVCIIVIYGRDLSHCIIFWVLLLSFACISLCCVIIVLLFTIFCNQRCCSSVFSLLSERSKLLIAL